MNKANIFSVYYQNCSGLKTKLHVLYMNILAHNYDIIILTETWLNDNISDNEYIDTRYRVFRCDRNLGKCHRKDGGGVLVAVRRELPASRRVAAGSHAPHASDAPAASSAYHLVDHVIVQINMNNKCWVVSATYIPPAIAPPVYEYHLNHLESCLQSSNADYFIVAGDFNLPSLRWRKGNVHMEPVIENSNSLSDTHMINFMSLLNCVQVNTFKNEIDRTLDLFFTNISESGASLGPVPLVPTVPHHPPFYVLIPIKNITKPMRVLPKTQYNYAKADYTLIKKEIESVDWVALLQHKTAEDAVSFLYENLYSIIRRNIPSKITKNSTFPVWFTPALIHIFKNKSKSWLKWKTYRNVSDYRTFSMYRERFKYLSHKVYKEYLNNVEVSIHGNINYFWKYINNLKRNGDIPNTMTYKDITTSDPNRVCNLFSDFFLSVFEPSDVTDDLDDSCYKDYNNESDMIISSIKLTQKEILKELRSLDSSKGAGVDGIPPLFFKESASAIYLPLHIIFNICLHEGTFPTMWKTARIVPVHKGGNRSDIENYRPISILPTLSKLFERLVHNNIYPVLHQIIIEEQHGFVSRRSTTTNLLIYISDLIEALDRNIQIDSVYTDFRKAFDRVDHKILLEKLAFNGIRGNLWRWFKSYITNRTQKVMINGFESEYVSITSGVPQGSILGPLLFILFVNDARLCFRFCKFLLYADDLKIYMHIQNSDDHTRFQDDLNRFSAYCNKNKLSLSINKCKSITFTRKRFISKFIYTLCNQNLEHVDSIRDLGVILDKKLNLDLHINNIIRKSFKMYGFVMRSCKAFVQSSTYLYIYKSLIRSQLEYAVAIWNPYYKKYSNALEMVQKKYLRTMQYRCCRSRESYNTLLKTHNLLPLTSRRTQLEMMLLFDICHNRYDCISLNNKICYRTPLTTHSRRPHQIFFSAVCRTNIGKRSPFYRLVDTFNKNFVSVDIFNDKVLKYKKEILKLLPKYTQDSDYIS